MGVEEYRRDRVDELASSGHGHRRHTSASAWRYDVAGDYEAVVGRPHQAWDNYFAGLASAHPA